MKSIRRVVTGHDQEGRSCTVMDGQPPVVIAIGPGSGVTELWASFNIWPDNLGNDDATLRSRDHRTPPSFGDKFRIVQFGPKEIVDAAELDRRLEELMRSKRMIGSVRNGLHRHESVDYAIVLQGEVWHQTEMDEVLLQQHDVVIQRGTYHAWHNRSDQPVVLAVVIRDARPLLVEHNSGAGASLDVMRKSLEKALSDWIHCLNAKDEIGLARQYAANANVALSGASLSNESIARELLAHDVFGNSSEIVPENLEFTEFLGGGVVSGLLTEPQMKRKFVSVYTSRSSGGLAIVAQQFNSLNVDSRS